ncbi:MAG: methionyl-tRNA formyltransferase [Deltaproteobacteria bacterium]|jgi:methionyl-tRNA formyltransferase|nr:methionyl-tRNA formyltransferase [Deltaproteobacteria bacterium]
MSLKIAFFGQAPFGREVLVRLLEAGHEIVGVYAPPEGGRPDPLAEEAEKRGLPLFRYKAMRRKGQPIASRVAEHAALGADLNVLAFVTMILPGEIVDAPRHGSLCFHPSLLPRFRGGNALAWQIIEGEAESGVTVFRPDAGVDTGPIVVQKGGIAIEAHHTAASLYFEKLYDLGVAAMCEAVDLVDRGEAPFEPQDEALATFQGLVDDAVAAVDWSRPAVLLDRQMRGCDPAPGAHTSWQGEELRLYDVTLAAADPSAEPAGTIVAHDRGAVHVAAPGGVLRVGRVRPQGGGKQAAAELLEIGARLG